MVESLEVTVTWEVTSLFQQVTVTSSSDEQMVEATVAYNMLNKILLEPFSIDLFYIGLGINQAIVKHLQF